MNPFKRFFDLLFTIYFNFHYLPFLQAVKLPIRLHNPKFVRLKGKVSIEGEVSRSMVRLGDWIHGGYPDGGFIFENNGGEIIFKGKVILGANSSFSVGQYGKLEICDNVVCIEGLKIVCFHHIKIENDCRIGWDVLMMDTSLHRLKNMDGSYTSTGVAPVRIGPHSWISTRCIIFPGAITAHHTIVAANSMLNKAYDEPYVLLAGSPAQIKKRGIYRDLDDDSIDFAKHSIIK